MRSQNTKLNQIQNKASNYFLDSIVTSWKRRSIGLIALLLGFYMGGNITVYFLEKTGQRPLVVLCLVTLIEIMIRLRSNVKGDQWPLFWLAIDNFRIGIIYAVVLEAFKLGS